MGDQVGGHSSTWKGWVGFAVGLLLGAAVGVALVVFAPVVIGVGVVAAGLATAAAVTGAVALAATGAMVVGRFAHTFDAPAVKGGAPCGAIVKGLDTVTIEHMAAARATDPVNHNGAQMRQGSATVLMRKLPASRNEDLSSCSGKVIKPATYTFIGGPPADTGKSTSSGLFEDALGAAAWTAKWFGLASMGLAVAAGFAAGGLVAGLVGVARMGGIWAGSSLVLTPLLSKLGDMQDRAEGHGGHEPVQSYGTMVVDNAEDQFEGAEAAFGFDSAAKARAAKSAADARADADDPAAHRYKDLYGGMSSFVTVGILEAGKLFKGPAKTGADLATPPAEPPAEEPPPMEVAPPAEECPTCAASPEPVETPPEEPPPPPEETPPEPQPEEEEAPQETEEEKAAREALEAQQYADGEKFFAKSIKDNPPKTPEAQAIAEKIQNGQLKVRLLPSDSDTDGGFRPPDNPGDTPTLEVRNQGRTPASQRGTAESMYHEGQHHQQWLDAGSPDPEGFYEYYKNNFAWMETEAEVTGRSSMRGPPSDELIAKVKTDFLPSYIEEFGEPPPGYLESNEIRPTPEPKCPTCDGADEAPPASSLAREKTTDLTKVMSQSDADESIVDHSPVLYRGDSRSPEQIKAAGGFTGRNPNNQISLADHLPVNRPEGQWVSGSKSEQVASVYARDPYPIGEQPVSYLDRFKSGGTAYKFVQDGGVDVDAAQGTGPLAQDNQEVAFSEPIPWENVHSYAEVKPALNADNTWATNADGSHVDPDAPLQWVKNPDYTGPKLPGDP